MFRPQYHSRLRDRRSQDRGRSIQGWEQDYRCPVSPDFFRITKALDASADEFSEIASEPTRDKPKTKAGKETGEDLKAAAKKAQRQEKKK